MSPGESDQKCKPTRQFQTFMCNNGQIKGKE